MEKPRDCDMARPILPKTFLDDEPFQVEQAEDGYVVGIPYVNEATSETKFKTKTCFGFGELCFYLENAFKEVRALREEEAKKP